MTSIKGPFTIREAEKELNSNPTHQPLAVGLNIYIINKDGTPEPEKPVKKIYTSSELFALTKNEQVIILHEYNIFDIPALEADRVNKILEVQHGC